MVLIAKVGECIQRPDSLRSYLACLYELNQLAANTFSKGLDTLIVMFLANFSQLFPPLIR